MSALAPIAVTMGEPAGIGPEIFAKAFLTPGVGDALPFVWLGDPRVVERAFAGLGASVEATLVAPDALAGLSPDPSRLAVIATGEASRHAPGRPAAEDAASVIAAIARGASLARSGAASALVTAPIAKKALIDTGFAFPGHTEFLAAETGAARAVMMLAVPGLRVVPVTIHEPLARVPSRLTADLIVETARIVDAALRRDFAIARPRLAVSGLNPHAGEDGAMGREEIETIRPAIDRLRGEGLDATGPHPADTLFHARARTGYDAALCMYHDQALIPLKTIDFDRGVNVTLGLPIVRTSPDHGTAFDIAGRGVANPASLIAAIETAAAMARARAS